MQQPDKYGQKSTQKGIWNSYLQINFKRHPRKQLTPLPTNKLSKTPSPKQFKNTRNNNKCQHAQINKNSHVNRSSEEKRPFVGHSFVSCFGVWHTHKEVSHQKNEPLTHSLTLSNWSCRLVLIRFRQCRRWFEGGCFEMWGFEVFVVLKSLQILEIKSFKRQLTIHM